MSSRVLGRTLLPLAMSTGIMVWPFVGAAQAQESRCLGNVINQVGTDGPDHYVDKRAVNPPPGALVLERGDVVDSGKGDDTFEFSLEQVVICTGAGDDRVRVLPGPDRVSDRAVIFLGVGGDELRAASGATSIFGGGGNGSDRLVGTRRDDGLDGGAQDDVIRAGLGDDKVSGSGGDDHLLGGPLIKRLPQGASDADELGGNAGNDLVEGGLGADWLEGLEGDDRLFDGFRSTVDAEARDLLDGDEGDDRIRGDDLQDRANGGRGTKDRCAAFREVACELSLPHTHHRMRRLAS